MLRPVPRALYDDCPGIVQHLARPLCVRKRHIGVCRSVKEQYRAGILLQHLIDIKSQHIPDIDTAYRVLPDHGTVRNSSGIRSQRAANPFSAKLAA